MKTRITLKLDTGVVRKAKVTAATERKSYDLARRRAFARLRKGFDLRWTPPASRDELHER